MARGIKRRITAAVSLALGIGLFIFVLQDIGVEKIIAAISQLGWWGTAVSFLNIAIMVAGWIWSWKILLNAYDIYPSLSLITRAVIAGHTLSYITPSMYFGGEPLRIYLVSKETGASSTRITATVVLWKLLEGGTLFSLVMLGSFNAIFSGILDNSADSESLFSVPLITAGTLTVIVVWGVVAWSFVTNRHWASRICKFLQGKIPKLRERLEKVCHWLAEAENNVHDAFTHHTKAIVKVFFISLVINLTVFMRPGIYFFFSSDILFGFKELTFIFALFFFTSTFLWLTPGGIGITEFALIGIFNLVRENFPASDAVAYSLTIKGLEMVFILTGIAILIHFGAVKLPRLKRNSSPPEDEVPPPV
jgi:hypothetical protein